MMTTRRQQKGSGTAGYYSLAQAARVLGVHYETAARWARSGKLAAVRLSRRKVLVPNTLVQIGLPGLAHLMRDSGNKICKNERVKERTGRCAG